MPIRPMDVRGRKIINTFSQPIHVGKIRGVVTVTTTQAKLPRMDIVCLVTAAAGRRYVRHVRARIPVAIAAGHTNVCTFQWKPRLVVIEDGNGPLVAGVAGGAVAAQ